MFYAVGYTNNGANEKKLGPFTTKDEAMKAGRSEAGITRGFSFSGVIDDSGNYVYHNSRACNSTNPVVANAMRASGGVARNANDWIDDLKKKKKKAMDEIDKKADALYRQLKDIARKFDALKNEQVKVGLYFADYSDAARQIREIHGME